MDQSASTLDVMDHPIPPSASPTPQLAVTPRTTFKRHPERGSHERALIDAILDEALVAHVGVTIHGAPCVMPTAHVRVGDNVYVHGARANHVLVELCRAETACLTVTLIDGLVLARSAFHHSMNYRSVMLYGRAREVTDREEKLTALQALIEHMAEGRWAETRTPTDDELRSTLVVCLPISEGGAKVRTGPPLDTPDQLDDPCWAGVLPLRLCALEPVPDPKLRGDVQGSAALARAGRRYAFPPPR